MLRNTRQNQKDRHRREPLCRNWPSRRWRRSARSCLRVGELFGGNLAIRPGGRRLVQWFDLRFRHSTIPTAGSNAMACTSSPVRATPTCLPRHRHRYRATWRRRSNAPTTPHRNRSSLSLSVNAAPTAAKFGVSYASLRREIECGPGGRRHPRLPADAARSDARDYSRPSGNTRSNSPNLRLYSGRKSSACP